MITLTVGSSGQQFTTLTAAVTAAQPGDTIRVQAGTYTNDFPSTISNLTIEGVGGQVNLVATEQPPNGKAILDVAGDVTLRNLTFSGVTVPDANGAGVRYESGNLTVEDCVFHDNQNGLFANPDPNGTISIQGSEFYRNGTSAGNTHNIYVLDIARFTLARSYVHDANVGHEVKSRAESNVIINNRIFDNDGTSSYSIDLPNGGDAVISSNTIEQGPNGQNPIIIAYGEEGGSATTTGALHAGTTVSFTGNTIVNDLTARAPHLFWNASGATISALGNTVYGMTDDDMGVGQNLPDASGFNYMSVRPTLDVKRQLGR